MRKLLATFGCWDEVDHRHFAGRLARDEVKCHDDAPLPSEMRQRRDVYYELGPGFTRMSAGAAWDDLKLGVAHYWHWEAVAVLTDHDWIRRAIDVFRFVVPAHIRTFPDDQAAEARDWIVSSLDKPTTRPS
ncbi:hypothetical protein AWV80_12550 [Cupriavidus sp. UYMU48A]|nr:hypothetical protein AWV80_12550 [Cupriavidus sp. UYMU48A]